MSVHQFFFAGALLSLVGCSSSDDSILLPGSGSSTGGSSAGSGGGSSNNGSGGAGSGASSAGGSSTGGAGSSLGGAPDGGTTTGGQSTGGTATGGGNTGGSLGTGGALVDPMEPKRCIGEPDASVDVECRKSQAGTMECSPLNGCGNEGGCAARISQNECILRGIGRCGIADGGATCIVRLNDPTDAFKGGRCVQASHGAKCSQQIGQGDCLSFDSDTGVENLCVWEAPQEPKCVALSCAAAPFEQACDYIAGCEWR